MNSRGHIVMAAGGTGGHLIPAFALAEELKGRGYSVGFVTDRRGAELELPIYDEQPAVIEAASPSRGSLINPLKTYFAIRRGKRAARRLYRERRPLAVVGFGGYPALPAIFAAFAMRIPVVIHEQNAVLGRVNRLVAGRADAIAVSYENTEQLRNSLRAKAALTGNPVREEVIAVGDEAYPRLTKDGILRLLVIGGSQGARVFSQVVPKAIGLLPPGLQRRLQITQQCRGEDIEDVRAAYRELNIPAELMTFIEDMPERLRLAHLVISRAGASSLAELAVAGRPSILVPLPTAMDDHQNQNAEALLEVRGALRIVEEDFDPTALAKQIQKLSLDPAALSEMAANVRKAGKPRAAQTLADLVEHVIKAPAGRRFGPADDESVSARDAGRADGDVAAEARAS